MPVTTSPFRNTYVDLIGLATIRWVTRVSGFHVVRPVLNPADVVLAPPRQRQPSGRIRDGEAYNEPVQRGSVQVLFRAFHDSGVRYLVAGGLAVVAHGYVRFTADVDLVLDMHPDNLRAAVDVLGTLGYRPRAPVALDAFLDVGTRAAWVRDKGMTVFSLYSPQHPATEVDVFVEEPFDFSTAYARRATQEIETGTPVTFVGLDDLLEMKRRAGRAQDVLDIERLRQVRRGPDDA